MKTLRKISLTTLLSVILIIVIAFFISQTVISQGKGQSKVQEEYCRELESNYVKEIRAYLSEQGYSNSGVTLTRTIEADGTRSYQVNIHNRRINRLDTLQKEKLLSECSAIPFPVNECSFYHEFLETDM